MNRVRVSMVRCSLVAFVLLATGCAYWGRRSANDSTPVGWHNPVWIWSGGEVQKWHAVHISQYFVSGIPYKMPLWCDGCRISLGRAQVDSMTLGYKTVPERIATGAGETVGLLAVFILLDGAVCYVFDPGDPQC